MEKELAKLPVDIVRIIEKYCDQIDHYHRFYPTLWRLKEQRIVWDMGMCYDDSRDIWIPFFGRVDMFDGQSEQKGFYADNKLWWTRNAFAEILGECNVESFREHYHIPGGIKKWGIRFRTHLQGYDGDWWMH